jgi:Raf kinase inhibitor-like YbhB/YbcL family protein
LSTDFEETTTSGVRITSPAFAPSGAIPKTHTLEGENLSPPLVFHDVPQGAKSLALIVDDPDAPDPAKPKVVWVHWLLYNLPHDVTGLAAGAGDRLPDGTLVGLNDWGKQSYGGPKPPIGRHRYFFRLYALDIRLPRLSRPNRQNLEDAMRGHVIAEAELMGTFTAGT